jgi:hypothetical protein
MMIGGVSQQMREENKAIWTKFDENNGIRIATGEKTNVSRKEEEKDENTSMSTITERMKGDGTTIHGPA